MVIDRLAKRLRDDTESAKLDAAMKTKTNKVSSAIIDVCLPAGQVRPDAETHISFPALAY